MSRKIFLSFLGTSIYKETYYIAENQSEEKVKATRFIQEATVLNFCMDFSEFDKIMILTTKGALDNWQNTQHYDFRSEETVIYEPLKSRLKRIGLKCSIVNIEIEEGKTPEELWSIFSKVFNSIHQKDEIIFDITHGFRTLPMFNMVLINYAKLLKDITVGGIYYGNYEARYLSNGKTFSPIWNLKDFATLQDWTNEANIFFKTGNAIPLANLIQKDKDFEIKKGLQNFSQYILVNRGLEILRGGNILKLREELNNYQYEKQTSPLVPIINKIKNEFDQYEDNSPINGFLATRWAIQNGLIQQAATLLEESVTTFVLFDIGQSEFVSDERKRTKASAAITIGDSTEFHFTNPDEIQEGSINYSDKREKAIQDDAWEKEFVPIIRNLRYKKKLGKLVAKIKDSVRNDINHAGFRENPRDFNGLESSITKRYLEIKKLLKDFKKLEIPEL